MGKRDARARKGGSLWTRMRASAEDGSGVRERGHRGVDLGVRKVAMIFRDDESQDSHSVSGGYGKLCFVGSEEFHNFAQIFARNLPTDVSDGPEQQVAGKAEDWRNFPLSEAEHTGGIRSGRRISSGAVPVRTSGFAIISTTFFRIPFPQYPMSMFRTLLHGLLIVGVLTAFVSTSVEGNAAVEQRRGETAKDNVFFGDRSFSFGDYDVARKYYERALQIDSKNVKANNRLAMIYRFGYGVKRNYERAIDYYRRASDLGDGGAAFNVATFYLKGEGVKRDFKEARRWLALSADRGCADALYQIGCLYFNGTSVDQDYREAMTWFERAAEKRYLPALVNIGYMMSNGLGCVKDPALGVQWYLHAAMYGSADAMRNLGGCYSTGNGVDKDKAEALKWYKKAAIAGDEASKKYLQRIGEYETPESQYKETPLVITVDSLDTDSVDVEILE